MSKTWSITEGAVPPGLVLTGATGDFAGTPTKAGRYSFTVSCIDSVSDFIGKKRYFLPVSIDILPISLPPGNGGVPYLVQLFPFGADLSTVSSTALPVVNSGTVTLTVETGLNIQPGVPVLISDGAGNTMGGTTVSYDPVLGTLVFTASRATGSGTHAPWWVVLNPVQWTVTAGSLPRGITLDPALGVVSGTPV